MEEYQEKDITFRELVNRLTRVYCYIMRNLKKVIGCAVVGAILFGIIAYQSSLIYHANISFSLDEDVNSSKLGAYASIIDDIGISPELFSQKSKSLISPYNLEVLFHTRSIIYEVLMTKVDLSSQNDSLMLIEHLLDVYPQMVSKEGKTYFRDYLSQPLGSYKKRDSVFISIHNILIDPENEFLDLDVARKKSSIFLLNVKSEDELLSHYLASLLLNQVRDYYIRYKTDRLNRQILYVQEKLHEASTQYGEKLASSISTSIPNVNMGIYSVSPKLMKEKEELSLRRNLYWKLLSELEQLKLVKQKETPIFQVIDASMLPLEVEEASLIFYIFFGIFLGSFLAIVSLVIFRYCQLAYYHSPV